MKDIHISPGKLPPECEALRQEVREFLAKELADYPAVNRMRSWQGRDKAFSKKLGAAGWLGMTWPKKYGGHEKSLLERYVVLEELLAAGAPVGAHWVADRQSGPLLIRHSPDELAPKIAPLIAKGEAYFCIGMSEPDSGSDLASIRTKATRVDGGWLINGRKVWTSGANHATHMIALVRTRPKDDTNRHVGMSQFLVQMNNPDVSLRPITTQLGMADFFEITFDDAFVPDENLIGIEGEGWQQVIGELKFERSGPERFLSSHQLMLEMIAAADTTNRDQTNAIGRLVVQYFALRNMSQGIAVMMSRNEDPAMAASLLKDQGALLEQSMPEIAYSHFYDDSDMDSDFYNVMSYLTVAAPSFSLRGGTREILRGIIAKGVGLK
nr:acyl-CoA dehydrogenase family protein [Advenella sp. S44]